MSATLPPRVSLSPTPSSAPIQLGSSARYPVRKNHSVPENRHGWWSPQLRELLAQTLERLAGRLSGRLEEHYANPDLTFPEKWRIVAQNWIAQPTSRFPKILLELSAMSWNIPQLRQRVSAVYARFRAIFERYFGEAMREYGLDESQFPLKVVAAAAGTFQLGVIVEGLSQFHEGHEELLTWVQSWLDSLEAAKTANA
jgi:AraC-like DNA-binding protein